MKSDKKIEENLLERLASIHKQVQWMADQEALSTWVKGLAAQGAHSDAKERLLEETDRVLEQLAKIDKLRGKPA